MKGNSLMSRRAGLDKQAVIEAAAQLVDEEGVDQLSLGRLAERLGIRTPSLYNHVAGLSGLKHDLALYCLRDLLDQTTHATIGKSRAEAIIALADAYRLYAKQTPGRYTLTQQAPDAGDLESQSLAQQVVDIVRAILVPYKLSDEDAIHAIRGLRSIVQGFVSLEVTGGFGLPVDLDSSFHWLINVFITGLDQPMKNGDQAHVTTGNKGMMPA
jgi:AcrR family transcriptional regulator